MKMEIKNRSHRSDIYRPRSGHGHKYTKYKMMLICVKQYLSNIEAQLVEKLSNTEAELEKAFLMIKSI